MTLKEYRALHKLTVLAFSRQLGVRHSTVLRWEDGSVKPSTKLIARIREITGGAIMPNDLYPDTKSLAESVAA
jgi:transcriptional regulator with XRE-family HTH domain